MTELNEISTEAQRRIRDLERDVVQARAETSEIKIQVALLHNENAHMKETVSDNQEEFKTMRKEYKDGFRRIFYPVAILIITIVIEFVVSGGVLGFLK